MEWLTDFVEVMGPLNSTELFMVKSDETGSYLWSKAY